MNSSRSRETSITQTLSVDRCDRWEVCQRLLELSVPAWRSTDGQLYAEVRGVTDAVHVYSVVRQIQAQRQEQADWLERCWQS
ncbi:hypothetical protein GS597_09810 [Synechococcales cyanobacterium C]|uniref:Uncharacterized protein n=1 Tax=Petrachloros mirabilis ULC683 TaxID=2781853 RepID=A0A8K1ZXP0_9CYAN|nr:Asr1405/Asl0597 family protein [Petrachloros mirabilis]NCJ06798.1 hypothetical protein [Petrachloros mirabilis ULC683]